MVKYVKADSRLGFEYTWEDRNAGRFYILKQKAIKSEKWKFAEFVGCFSTFDEALDEAKKRENRKEWQITDVRTGETKTGGHCLWKNVRCEPND